MGSCMKKPRTIKKDLGQLLNIPVPFEMDLPWGDYRFSRRFYEIVNDWGIPTKIEANFIRSYVKSKPAIILDLACGGGRHALKLTSEGHQVTGIDIGGFPIENAQRAARKEGLKIRLVRKDIRQISYCEEFDLAYLICGQLGHFSPEDAQRIFSRATEALRQKGIFIVHLPVFGERDRENVTLWYREKEPFYFVNPAIVHREQYYFEEAKVKLIRDFAVDTVTRKNRLFGVSEKSYSPDEIKSLGQNSGLELTEVYGDYRKAPLTEDSSNNIYVFAKK